MTTTEELALIDKIVHGDEAAFTEIYNKYRKHVKSLCYKYCGENADDAEQEVWMHLFKKLGTFKGNSKLSTWLHRVTTNECLMILRKETFRRDGVVIKKSNITSSLDDDLVSIDGAKNNDEDSMRREIEIHDRQLESSIDRITVHKLLHEMEESSPGYVKTLITKYLFGMEHNEIARVMGTTIGNSKSQANKGREKLLTLLRRKVTHARDARRNTNERVDKSNYRVVVAKPTVSSSVDTESKRKRTQATAQQRTDRLGWNRSAAATHGLEEYKGWYIQRLANGRVNTYNDGEKFQWSREDVAKRFIDTCVTLETQGGNYYADDRCQAAENRRAT